MFCTENSREETTNKELIVGDELFADPDNRRGGGKRAGEVEDNILRRVLFDVEGNSVEKGILG